MGEDDKNIPVADIITHVCLDGQHSAAYMEQNGYLLTAGSQTEGEDPLLEDDPLYNEQDAERDEDVEDNKGYGEHEGEGTDENSLEASTEPTVTQPRPQRVQKKADHARLFRFWDD